MSSNKNWVLQVDPAVYKFLKKIPRAYAERILFAIRSLPSDPFAGDIQKMGGEENAWRRRLGNYRMEYEIIVPERIIHVFCVERRTSSTY